MKRKTIRIIRSIPIVSMIPLASALPLTSCGIFSGTWDWLSTTKNNTEINYCLLIGQNDHTDSQMRTHGSREALGTLDKEAAKKDGYNANIAKPVDGEITLYKGGDKSSTTHQTFKVKEVEHMEQKSIGGASWDPITANATASTWIAKHGSNLTFFVSNNDSMAEGAYWASNWIKGMPIFGYDANSSTLQWINTKNGITGTVDQSPSNQAAAAMMVLRNMYEDRINYWNNGLKPSEANHNYGTVDYDPTYQGFDSEHSHPTYGNVNKGNQNYFTLRKDRQHDKSGKIFDKREILSKSQAITKTEWNAASGAPEEDILDISKFIKDDNKTAKQPVDMFDQFTDIKKDAQSSNKIKICHTYSNRSEAFLIATMKPYYNEYASRMGIEPDIIEGDGTDEKVVLDQIDARQDEYDGGYLICLAKTTSAYSYVLDLAKRSFKYESKVLGNKKPGWKWNDNGWEKFDDRLDIPLIFWIREPSTPAGKKDDDVLWNKYFKYTYYIGSDSANAGEVQGKLITSAITRWYTDSLNK